MGNSIEWGKSWNPVKGQCPHNEYCFYCYMKGFNKRFKMNPELRLDKKTLAHVPKGDRIFVCSNLDLFAEAIPEEWIKAVIQRIETAFQWEFEFAVEDYKMQFMFLTKNPGRYKGLFFDKHLWTGTTWDGLEFTKYNCSDLYYSTEGNRFISFEPLFANPEGEEISHVDWIIIGADSRRGQPKPPKEWADYLIEQAREYNIPVFVKSNYGYPEIIQEFPE